MRRGRLLARCLVPDIAHDWGRAPFQIGSEAARRSSLPTYEVCASTSEDTDPLRDWRPGAGPVGASSSTGAGPPTDTRRTAPMRQKPPSARGEDTACMSDVSVFQGGSQRARTEDTGLTGHPIKLSVPSSSSMSSGRPAYPSSVWFSPVASPPRRYSSTRPAGSWISVCWGNRRSTWRARDSNRSNDCASMLRSGLPFGSV